MLNGNMGAPIALRLENWHASILTVPAPAPVRKTFDGRLELSLSTSTASRCGRIWLAQAGNFLFRFGPSCTSSNPQNIRFFS
jgi:hypothetical protein